MLKQKEKGRRRKLLKWWQLDEIDISFYKCVDATFKGHKGTWYYIDGLTKRQHSFIGKYDNTYVAKIGPIYAPEIKHDAIFIAK